MRCPRSTLPLAMAFAAGVTLLSGCPDRLQADADPEGTAGVATPMVETARPTPRTSRLDGGGPPGRRGGRGSRGQPPGGESISITPVPAPTGPAPEGVPKLRVYYNVHVHVDSPVAPYTNPAMTQLDRDQAQRFVDIIEGIAAVADRHGLAVNWQPTAPVARGIRDLQGKDNVLKRLEDEGHIIGVHVHRMSDLDRTIAAIDALGVTPRNATAGLLDARKSSDPEATMDAAIVQMQKAGLEILANNMSPLEPRNPFGSTCTSWGIGNDMYRQTGNHLFPWKPDYRAGNVCGHDPKGSVIYVDSVGPTWLVGPGREGTMITEGNFDQLRTMVGGAMAYLDENKPSQVAAWGFVTHILEYSNGAQGGYELQQKPLDALDGFLTWLDAYRRNGRLEYSTVNAVADEAF